MDDAVLIQELPKLVRNAVLRMFIFHERRELSTSISLSR